LIQDKDWKVNGQYNYIELYNGSRIDLLDLKHLPTDPLFERFGSLEYTDGAIEEAGEIHFLAYDVLKSRVGRHMNKEYRVRPTTLITGNPKKNWTYTEFYKPWRDGKLPQNISFIQSLYQDNEHTADEYGKQLSQLRDPILRERLMNGNWEYENEDTMLVKYDHIVDLFTNTASSGLKYITADVARYGSDKTVIMVWDGYNVIEIKTFEQSSIQTTSEAIRNLAKQHLVPYSQIIVDEDGIGGGVVDILSGVKGFIANTSPMERIIGQVKENYKNLKTQCSYILAQYINIHKIAIQNSGRYREDIIQEIEQLKRRDIDQEGKLKIMPKDEIKEIIGRSPDFLDCLTMRMYFELAPSYKQSFSNNNIKIFK